MFVPAARAPQRMGGLGISPLRSNGQVVIAGVEPRYLRDPRGPRLGDVVDIAAMPLDQRARLYTQTGGGLDIPVARGAERRSVAVTSSSLLPPPPARWIGAATLATVTIGVATVLLIRQPSLMAAALLFYGFFGSVYTRPITAELGWLPNDLFTVLLYATLAAGNELPLFALMFFVTRFPAVPTDPAGRMRMRLGDRIFWLGAVACAALTIFEPYPFIWEPLHLASESPRPSRSSHLRSQVTAPPRGRSVNESDGSWSGSSSPMHRTS